MVLEEKKKQLAAKHAATAQAEVMQTNQLTDCQASRYINTDRQLAISNTGR